MGSSLLKNDLTCKLLVLGSNSYHVMVVCVQETLFLCHLYYRLHWKKKKKKKRLPILNNPKRIVIDNKSKKKKKQR